MSEIEYEYHGLMAQSWDLFRGDTSDWDDRHFFLALIRETGEPVLDVGCGTGRLLLDYLALGIDIDGVDNSPEMLDLCSNKAANLKLVPRLYQASMESMDLPRKYRTMLVPSSSFQLVLEPLMAQQAIRCFYEHLLPGGTLAMSFMRLWKDGDDSSWRLTGEKVIPQEGVVMRRWSRNWFDQETQLEHTEDRYEKIRDGEIIASEYHTRSPATRQYTQEQAHRLYSDAGFIDIKVCQGFFHNPASINDDLFTVLGRKQGALSQGN